MQETILEYWTSEWPESRVVPPLPTGEGVIDQAAFHVIEVDELFATVNYAQTTIGQAVLYRSLARPSSDRELIEAKQTALAELQAKPALRQELERIVDHAAKDENALYQLLYGSFLGSLGTPRHRTEAEGYGYEAFRKSARLFLTLVDQVTHATPPPESTYLQQLFDRLRHFATTRPYQLLRGPVYRTESAIYSKEERRGSWTPAIIFRPTLFKPLLILSLIVLAALVIYFYPAEMYGMKSSVRPLLSILSIPLILLYIPMVGTFDRDSVIYPLREQLKADPEFRVALDTLGQLDELLALLRYAEHYGSAMCLPELRDGAHHSITLRQARNPILGHGHSEYVANDFDMARERLVFITGPNSGGKTAFCKTVTQIQLLAQIGSFVPAEYAALTIADRIFYQAPEISHLDDGEGRFGTELKRTRDIFLASTPHSLVVLDELSEGTTFEEKLATSIDVLDGFRQKGCSTILITHNHQLVDYFVERGLGIPRQVEFADEQPTYRLIDGISRVSHADRVAKKIGFSKEDIAHYLAGNTP